MGCALDTDVLFSLLIEELLASCILWLKFREKKQVPISWIYLWIFLVPDRSVECLLK